MGATNTNRKGVSVEFATFARGLHNIMKEREAKLLNSPMVHSRINGTMAVTSRAPMQTTSHLRVTAADAEKYASKGITEQHIGKFWRVYGYSDLNGDDVPRP